MKTRHIVAKSFVAAFCLAGLAALANAGTLSLAPQAVNAAAIAQAKDLSPAKNKQKLRELVRGKEDQLRQNRALVTRDPILESDPITTPDGLPDPKAAVADAEPQQPAPAPAPAAPAGQMPAPASAPGAAAAPAQQFAPGEGPQLIFENPAHDFGTVFDTTPLVTKFKFTNKGKAKLTINAINTGCGCTAAKLPKNDYEPGESGEIEITYSPKGSGKQQRAMNVTSNDPAQPNYQLSIAANVVPLFEARPTNIQFGQVSIGETRSVQLVVVSRDKNMKITSVESNGPEVEAIVVPDGKPQVLVEQELPGVAVIDVKLKDNAPVGRIMRQLTIKAMVTKAESEPATEQELKVFVFGQVQGELNLNPQQIRVAPTAPETDFEREVIITRRGNTDFKLLSAEVVNSTVPGITATTEPYQMGDIKGYKVKLKGKTGPTPGNFRGSVKLTTDVAREETVDVQFSGIVRAAAAVGAPGSSPTNAIPVQPQNVPQSAPEPAKPAQP